MIGDVISAAATQGNFDYITLLLGKLEQLAAMGVSFCCGSHRIILKSVISCGASCGPCAFI